MTKLFLITLIAFLSACNQPDTPPCHGQKVIIHTKDPHSGGTFTGCDTVVLEYDSTDISWFSGETTSGPSIIGHSQTGIWIDSVEAGLKKVKRKHKPKPINMKFVPAGTSIAADPYFQIKAWGITDSSGKIVAKRDSAGNWDIKDPARALEVMYKIVNKR